MSESTERSWTSSTITWLVPTRSGSPTIRRSRTPARKRDEKITGLSSIANSLRMHHFAARVPAPLRNTVPRSVRFMHQLMRVRQKVLSIALTCGAEQEARAGRALGVEPDRVADHAADGLPALLYRHSMRGMSNTTADLRLSHDVLPFNAWTFVTSWRGATQSAVTSLVVDGTPFNRTRSDFEQHVPQNLGSCKDDATPGGLIIKQRRCCRACATRCASPTALMRRGCVQTMLQAPPRPCATASSKMNCGTCVLLPHPAPRPRGLHSSRLAHCSSDRVPCCAGNSVQLQLQQHAERALPRMCS